VPWSWSSTPSTSAVAIPTAPLAEQVEDAVREVARPVFAAVLVIVLVYVPVLALTGVEGKLYRPMAITVVLALVVALVFSLTLVPAALASGAARRLPARDPIVIRLLDAVYGWLLPRVTARPVAVAAAAIAALIAAGALFARAGVALTPELDEGDLVVQTTRAPDLRVDEAVAAATRMEAALRARVPEIRQIVSRLGSPAIATDTMGLDQADVFVGLHPRARWRPGLDRAGLIAEMQAVIDLATPGSEPAFTQPIQMRFNELLGGSSTDVALAVVGDDLAALWQVARALTAALAGVRGVVDARILAPPEVGVIDVRPSPLAAARVGLSSGDVLDAVAALRLGLPAGVAYVGARAVPVVVTLGAAPPTADGVAAARLPAPGGLTVALRDVAAVEARTAAGMIAHEEGKRRLVIGWNVRGRDLGGALADARTRVDAVALPAGIRLAWGGQYQALEEAKARLALVVPAVLVLILVVLGLTFGHVRPALIVFGHVPFAGVGGIAALTARGLPLSVAAAVGFIALSGHRGHERRRAHGRDPATRGAGRSARAGRPRRGPGALSAGQHDCDGGGAGLRADGAGVGRRRRGPAALGDGGGRRPGVVDDPDPAGAADLVPAAGRSPGEGGVRILVVEDEARLAGLIARGLGEEGHQVTIAVTAAAATAAIGLGWDVVILDWGLPDQDGVTLLARWRRRGIDVPVLMLTARGATGERVTGLRAGADDYLIKPFDFEELLARLDAVTRRTRATGPARVGRLILDERSRTLGADERVVALSPRELDVARVLVTRAGDVMTRAELLAEVWGRDFDGPPNVVDVYVGYLRAKLRELDEPAVIETVRGLGYRLVAR
jgi:DNA-binding response OmpR family regulator